MTQPKRIQRKRTAGWRMPEGAVYVGRPTKVEGTAAAAEAENGELRHQLNEARKEKP